MGRNQPSCPWVTRRETCWGRLDALAGGESIKVGPVEFHEHVCLARVVFSLAWQHCSRFVLLWLRVRTALWMIAAPMVSLFRIIVLCHSLPTVVFCRAWLILLLCRRFRNRLA